MSMPRVLRPGVFLERAAQVVSKVEAILNEIGRTLINVIDPLDSDTASCRLHGRLTVGSALNIAELSLPGKEDIVQTFSCIDVIIHRLLQMRRICEIEQIVKRVKKLERYYGAKQNNSLGRADFGWFKQYTGKWYLELAFAVKEPGEDFGRNGLVLMNNERDIDGDLDIYAMLHFLGMRLDEGGVYSFLYFINDKFIHSIWVPPMPIDVLWRILMRIGNVILDHPLLTEDQKKRMQQILSAFYAKYYAFIDVAPQPTGNDVPAVDENEEIDKPTFAEFTSVGLIENMDGWDRVEGYAGLVESLRKRGMPISPFIARRARRSLAALGRK